MSANRIARALSLASAFSLIMGWSLGARAQVQPPADGDPGEHRAPQDKDHRASLRLGGATTDTVGKPTLCLEARAVWKLSLETCGTGSGILYAAGGNEMAHFRANLQLYGTDIGLSRLRLRGGLGFAELQIGEDEAGFEFGNGSATSAAGPEASFSGQWLIGLAAGTEFVATGTVGAGWFAGAPDLADPHDHFQPFASFDIGIGF